MIVRPLEQRIHLHNRVLMLRKRGLSYNEIIGRIHRQTDVSLSKSHVSFWVRRCHEPCGNVNSFDGKPSPELAGIIGSLSSDGTRYSIRNGLYRFVLQAKDREYVEAFGHDLSRILGKSKPYRPRWIQLRKHWRVVGYSALLFKQLNKPFKKLKPYIEANRPCVARFLKGFFDGEGSIRGRSLVVYNTRREMLLYVKHILKRYFDIETTGPHRIINSRSYLRDPISGKIYQRNKACFYLRVRAQSLIRFKRYIGFTIKRKQRRLIQATKE